MREEEPFRGSHDEERGKLIQIYDSMDVQQSKCGSVCRVRILSLLFCIFILLLKRSENSTVRDQKPKEEKNRSCREWDLFHFSPESPVCSLPFGWSNDQNKLKTSNSVTIHFHVVGC